ncbi:MAG: phosphate ABC transporter substrate-binding protein PstS, partial [Thermoproteota archaeon]
MMNYKIVIPIAVIAIIVAGVFAYQYLLTPTQMVTSNDAGEPSPSPPIEITLNGTGASFPFPLIDKWTVEYHKIKPNVRVNYQSIGSGGGIRQHTNKTVYFGATNAPLTEKQSADAPNTLNIPITIGGVVPIYNVPGIPKGLKFTGKILADIFLGKITKWNDPRLTTLNPEISLPDHDIIVVHRSDGSGTTFVFTDYLSNISQEWK